MGERPARSNANSSKASTRTEPADWLVAPVAPKSELLSATLGHVHRARPTRPPRSDRTDRRGGRARPALRHAEARIDPRRQNRVEANRQTRQGEARAPDQTDF